MPNKTPIAISVILLIIVGIGSMFGQIVLLNGVMDATKGNIALGIGLGCNGVTILFAGIFSRWLAKLLLGKANWPAFPSVAVAVIVSVGLGVFFSFMSIIVGTMAAGIR